MKTEDATLAALHAQGLAMLGGAGISPEVLKRIADALIQFGPALLALFSQLLAFFSPATPAPTPAPKPGPAGVIH